MSRSSSSNKFILKYYGELDDPARGSLICFTLMMMMMMLSHKPAAATGTCRVILKIAQMTHKTFKFIVVSHLSTKRKCWHILEQAVAAMINLKCVCLCPCFLSLIFLQWRQFMMTRQLYEQNENCQLPGRRKTLKISWLFLSFCYFSLIKRQQAREERTFSTFRHQQQAALKSSALIICLSLSCCCSLLVAC